MIAVIQRVSRASVHADGQLTGQIGTGLLVLLGIAITDTVADLEWLVQKIPAMRIFNDAEGKMNLALADVQGQMLVVSQFTLLASTKKGNRPSYIEAARPEQAVPLYEAFVQALRGQGITVATGIFGADMKVELLNDGPVTIVIDSQNRR